MDTSTEDTGKASFFSSICTERCGGVCCDPWWGIISYSVTKHGGLSNLQDFRDEMVKGIKARGHRIVEAYVTNEIPPRPLFKSPDRYNVIVRKIDVNGSSVTLSLLTMFAFRCGFLSEENACAVHPSLFMGLEIRPPHCGYTGSPNARPDEKGCCRVIHAAISGDGPAVDNAVRAERAASLKHYGDGAASAEEAADRVMDALKEHCSRHAQHLSPQQKRTAPGRNDPCPCGSGKKFKKCHG
ncbi:MAG: SEC-C metal-binding domain-containing protein [Deltaproteobacteria bacterium]